VVAQATELASQLPQYAADLQRFVEESPQLRRFDEEYQVTQRIQAELEKRVSSGETVTAVFGGIFGAGRAVVSGIFSALTVLVLTLYFLASLRGLKEAGYRLVPASRRQRVALLGDEVSKRIGGYVGGQLSLAAINGIASFVVLTIMGIPYAAVLAFTVGLLGIIPLVGATLGAVIVVIVALFTSVTDAVILTIYYLLYQQFENYVLGPRIMARTVSVPGAVALVAALAGGSLLGILGALIAIPLAAGVLLIVQEVVMPQQDRS
jgi:predicted PurR-regulated permease PerM